MAGMTAKHNKNGSVTYSFRGDLGECIRKAQKELEQKVNSDERKLLKWQYEKAKKAHETYERRIDDLKGFVRLALEELEKTKTQTQEEK